jgi:mannose-1-phosphate guanylyltransferase/mannose-6-phosphate isomerase
VTSPIIPVILCGGGGTRLWPLSRADYPKQFARITGPESLFQAAVRRVAVPGFAPARIVTGSSCRFLAARQMAETGIVPAAVLLEPEGRDTAPAVLAAALSAAESAPDAVLLVCPSDHVIGDPGALQAAVRTGRAAAEAGHLVTFGVRPDGPQPAYGHLELPAPLPCPAPPGPHAILRFVEKPDPVTAAAFAASGRHWWNSGLFLFSVQGLLDAAAEHAPELLARTWDAVQAARTDLGFLRLDPEAWAAVPRASLDRAVMERADGVRMVPLETPWSDLGGWDAVGRAMGADASGTSVSGPAEAIDCEGSLLRAESPGQALVGIGLRGIVAVAMPDAVLVADRRAGERVRLAVERLGARAAPQAAGFPRCHRPWGWYESLAAGERFQVKRIMVHPGARLSLQSHVHRAEHWVVVAGSARVTVGVTTRLLAENESLYVAPGEVHRLENPGRVDLHLIEVQTGPYLGEDDIIRLEDAYARDGQE